VTKVVCLLTGDKYPQDYIIKLYRGLQKHTTQPFDFEVITETKYPGWWGKMEQFPPKERIILLDVDLVITGNVDFLFEYQGQFCCWRDPWADGLNGSVHSIAPGFGESFRKVFDSDPDAFMRRYYSDQEFLRDYTLPDYWPSDLIKSYKADSLEDGPRDSRIVVFHGKPKPHEIKTGWVAEAWQ
jgi:hypothetical protein